MIRSARGNVIRSGLALVAISAVLVGCGSGDPAASASSGGATEAPPHPGQVIYQRSCFACHAAGLAGAPKHGDVAAWQPRIAKGRALLLKGTIEGIAPAMPAKGNCFDCSDAELEAALDYMLAAVAAGGG